jgi:ABC-2 type transport system permease protein
MVLIAPTLLYVLVLRIHGQIDYGPILSGYLGIVLVGTLFVSIILFCSSLTRSQLIALVLGVFILAIVTILPYLAAGLASLPPFWRNVADQAVFRRYMDFSKGVIDTSNIVFFLAATTVFLFLTVKVLESRRWK